jgi:Uri superfamily endonuclease
MLHPPGPRLPLPRLPGVYAVELRLNQPQQLSIGRLGPVVFPAIDYLYLGSACGPGGLYARLGRHLKGGGKTLHWHIDWLRAAAEVRAYAALALPPGDPALIGLECNWRRVAAGWPGAWTVLPGFGSSDCRSGCPAHLVALPPHSSPYLSEPGFLDNLAGRAAQEKGQLIYG